MGHKEGTKGGQRQVQHCSCCGWQKGMSQAEVMLNSEEIKPIALSIYSKGMASVS